MGSDVQNKLDEMKAEIDALEKDCKEYFETDEYKKYVEIRESYDQNPTPFLKSTLRALEGRQNAYMEKKNRLETVKRAYEKKKKDLLSTIYVENQTFTPEEVRNGCSRKVLFEDGTELIFKFQKNSISHGRLQYLKEFPKYQVRTYISDNMEMAEKEEPKKVEPVVSNNNRTQSVSFRSHKPKEVQKDPFKTDMDEYIKIDNSFQLKIKTVEQEIKEKLTHINEANDQLSYNKELLKKLNETINLLQEDIQMSHKDLQDLQLRLNDLKQKELEHQKIEKEMKSIDEQIAELLRRKNELLGK